MQLSISNHVATIAKDGTPITKFAIKQGDTYPDFTISIVEEDGTFADLSPFTKAQVIVSETIDARPIINVKDIVPGAGQITFPLTATMTAKPGSYLVEVTFTNPDTGRQMTVPGNDYGAFIINPRLYSP